MLDLEASIERALHVFPSESAEEIRPHAGVQILADLEGDLDFFREGRRNVAGYLILRCIETRGGRKSTEAGPRAMSDVSELGLVCACSRSHWSTLGGR